MANPLLTRRTLARLVGAAAGASLLDSGPAGSIARAGTLPAARTGPIRLSSNENPYGPCKASLDALLRSGNAASRYPDALEDEAREKIARHHGVAPERIVLGCGSSDVLRMADTAFLGPGRTVVSAEPTFEAVLLYAGVTRAEPVKVPLTADFRHDLPAMAAACGARTGLVYVCNPNNPTGTIVTGDELEAFFEKVPPSVVVLVDEAYHHFVENSRYRSALDLLGRHDNVVVARTFSKVYGLAGMRLGYAVASPDNARALERCASFSNTNESVLAMALAGLADPDAVPRPRKLLNDTRRWLCAELEKERRRYIPSEANFVMIDVGSDVMPFAEKFRQRGIHVGRRFPSMPNWLRVSIGTRQQMEEFVATLRDVVPARAAA
jgi:histidinol-phosphate aminotransferase